MLDRLQSGDDVQDWVPAVTIACGAGEELLPIARLAGRRCPVQAQLLLLAVEDDAERHSVTLQRPPPRTERAVLVPMLQYLSWQSPQVVRELNHELEVPQRMVLRFHRLLSV